MMTHGSRCAGCHVGTRPRSRVTQLQAKKASYPQSWKEARKSLCRSQRTHSPTGTFTPDSWPLELQERKFWLFEQFSLCFCSHSPGKPTEDGTRIPIISSGSHKPICIAGKNLQGPDPKMTHFSDCNLWHWALVDSAHHWMGWRKTKQWNAFTEWKVGSCDNCKGHPFISGAD